MQPRRRCHRVARLMARLRMGPLRSSSLAVAADDPAALTHVRRAMLRSADQCQVRGRLLPAFLCVMALTVPAMSALTRVLPNPINSRVPPRRNRAQQEPWAGTPPQLSLAAASRLQADRPDDERDGVHVVQ